MMHEDDADPVIADPVTVAAAPDLAVFAPPMQLPCRRGWRRRLVAIGALLVVSGIAASVALPKYFSARLNRNESAVIGALKNISSAQSQMQASGALDVDGNGQGEFAFLSELSGKAPLASSGERLMPAVLQERFGEVHDGCVEIGGYVLMMFLPSTDGGWVTEATRGQAGREVDTKRAEVEWMCYAWPSERGWSGNRAFLITNHGDVFATNMSAEVYSGRIAPAGGVSGHCMEAAQCRPAANTVDLRGNTWVVV